MGKVEGDQNMRCTSEQQSINYNSLGGFYFLKIIKRDSCFIMVMIVMAMVMMTVMMVFNFYLSFRSRS